MWQSYCELHEIYLWLNMFICTLFFVYSILIHAAVTSVSQSWDRSPSLCCDVFVIVYCMILVYWRKTYALLCSVCSPCMLRICSMHNRGDIRCLKYMLLLILAHSISGVIKSATSRLNTFRSAPNFAKYHNRWLKMQIYNWIHLKHVISTPWPSHCRLEWWTTGYMSCRF